MRLAAVTVLFLILGACGILSSKVDDTPDTTDTDDGSDTDTDDGSDADTDSPSGPPVILSFTANTFDATEVDTIILSAIVTDPDGIDDVIGGTLVSPNGRSYGSFQTAAAEGAYSISMEWDDLNTVDTIVLDEQDSRTFTAEFFDQAGNVVTDSLIIDLSCDNAAESTCHGDGECRAMNEPAHCGICDNDCADRVPDTVGDPDVTASTLYCLSDGCLVTVIVDNRSSISCDAACGDLTCTNARIIGSNPTTCSDTSTRSRRCQCE